MKKSLSFILIGATLGNLCEWYNFLLYGYLASVISQLFFPTQNRLLSLTLTFIAFALSFLARPLGGILFGWIGDTYGRQRALIFSLASIGISTLLIGLLPTYHQIGIASPILLCIFRILQGFSAGGEHTGSAIYLAEQAPLKHRTLWVSLVPSSAAFGILLSSLAALIMMNYFTTLQLLQGAWRIGYFAGAGLCLFSLFWRLFLPESPLFKQALEHKVSLTNLFKDTVVFKNLIVVFCLASSWGIIYQALFVWMPIYLSHIQSFSNSHALSINSFFIAIFAILIIITALIADYTNKQRLLKLSCILMLLLSYPLFYMLNLHSVIAIYLGISIYILLFSIFLPIAFISMIQAFPIKLRYTGLSFGFNLGLALFGGTCPLILTWLIKITNDNLSPAWYFMFAAFIALVCSYKISDETTA